MATQPAWRKKSSFFQVGADAVGIDALALDEGLLDAERSVDQTGEGFDISENRGTEAQAVRSRS